MSLADFEQNPFAEVAEGRFLFFSRKKKGLKGFMVLVGTACRHTLMNIKYSVILYLEVVAGKSENASHLCHLKGAIYI